MQQQTIRKRTYNFRSSFTDGLSPRRRHDTVQKSKHRVGDPSQADNPLNHFSQQAKQHVVDDTLRSNRSGATKGTVSSTGDKA